MKLTNKTAFSLVELLVALSILAVVAAIIVPRFVSVRNVAAQTAAAAQLKVLKEVYNNWIGLGGQVAGGVTSGDVLQFLATQAALATPRSTPATIAGVTMTDVGGNFGSTSISLGGISIASVPAAPVIGDFVNPGWFVNGAIGSQGLNAYFSDGSGSAFLVTVTPAGGVSGSVVTGSVATAFPTL